ncbi:MAG: UDP-N-acetylmuramoyl-tripeptide--D-alanyl-D-alanine ligase [Janthinobacterium lividum]
MTMLTIDEAAAMMSDARVLGAHATSRVTSFKRVTTDSRDVRAGDLFIALRGDLHDAHDFLGDAIAKGAVAVVTSRAAGDLPVPEIRVADTRSALGALAHGWRSRFALPLVVVTGSNGKTTVKEMIASIFRAAVGAEAVLATRGNLNNDIGVPLTLLGLSAAHRLAVVELGMNHPGETAGLARMAAPTVALVNNAQREHQEFMADVETVALEHATAIHALKPDGVAVYPADETYEPIWRVAATGNPIISFALVDSASPQAAAAAGSASATPAASVDATPGGPAHTTSATRAHSATRRSASAAEAPVLVGSVLPQPAGVTSSPAQLLHIDGAGLTTDVLLGALGRHNARNALAAAACALAAGVSASAIQAGLQNFEPVKGRLRSLLGTRAPFVGATVIDDSYNANPDSVRAAIDVLAARGGHTVLVLGDMGEVGEHGPAFHLEIGGYARERGIKQLFGFGDAMRDACAAFGAAARHFESIDTMIDALAASAPVAAATVLVKGSRFMRMERVVDALAGAPGTARHGN